MPTTPILVERDGFSYSQEGFTTFQILRTNALELEQILFPKDIIAIRARQAGLTPLQNKGTKSELQKHITIYSGKSVKEVRLKQLRDLLEEAIAKTKTSALEKSYKTVTKKWLQAQLRHYGIDKDPKGTAAVLRKRLEKAVKSSDFTGVVPDAISGLEEQLREEYAEKMADENKLNEANKDANEEVLQEHRDFVAKTLENHTQSFDPCGKYLVECTDLTGDVIAKDSSLSITKSSDFEGYYGDFDLKIIKGAMLFSFDEQALLDYAARVREIEQSRSEDEVEDDSPALSKKRKAGQAPLPSKKRKTERAIDANTRLHFLWRGVNSEDGELQVNLDRGENYGHIDFTDEIGHTFSGEMMLELQGKDVPFDDQREVPIRGYKTSLEGTTTRNWSDFAEFE